MDDRHRFAVDGGPPAGEPPLADDQQRRARRLDGDVDGLRSRSRQGGGAGRTWGLHLPTWPAPPQWHGLVRPRLGHQPPGARLDQLLRGLLLLRDDLPGQAHRPASCPMGHAEVQATAGQAGHGLGLAERCSSAPPQALRPLAPCLAHLRPASGEPYDGRPSRTVLREPGGVIPPGHSPEHPGLVERQQRRAREREGVPPW